MMISMNDIRERMGENSYYEAYDLYLHDCIENLNTVMKPGALEISARVLNSRTRTINNVTCYLSSRYNYWDANCDCAEERSYGICRHSGAVMIKFAAEGFTENYKKDELSDNARQLLQLYSPEKEAPAERVSLQPLLNLSSGIPSLAFKIGNGASSYIIKNLSEFASCMDSGKTVRYGAKLTFDHNPAAFDSDSLFWSNLICERTTAVASLLGNLRNGSKTQPDINELPLSGRDFDMVFEKQLSEKHIANRQSGGRFNLNDANPNLSIIAEKHRIYYTIKTDPPARLLKGAEHSYAVIGTDIYRLTPDYAEKMGPVIQYVHADNGSLLLTESGAKEFCMNVLPQLEGYTEQKGLTVLDYIKPEDAVVSYLIDMPEFGRLTASVTFYYGNKYVDPASSDEDYPDIRRNLTNEKLAIRALCVFFDPPTEPGGLYEMTDEERIYEFLKNNTEKLAKFGQVFVTDRLKNRGIAKTLRPVISLKVDGGMLNFDIDYGEFPPDELSRLMRCVREKRKYYRLTDGRFMSIEDSGLDDFAQTTDTLGITDGQLSEGSITLPLSRALYIDGALKDSNKAASVNRDSSFKRLIRDFKTVEESDFEVPESLEGIMRNYQKTGFRWLRTLDAYRFGGILADDMGLGKTLQVLSYLQSLKNENKLTSASLIVCPASLVLNWGDEAEKWTPGLRTCLLTSGDPRRNEIAHLADRYDLIVTSYDLLRRDIDMHTGNKYYACILDEAQYIKNRETQSAKAVRDLTAKVRFALTGTPVENRLSELWSIFEFIMPGYLGKYSKFRDRWEKPITLSNDASAKASLTRLVHPFILRRMKSEVLTELPPKSEMCCYIEMEEIQRKYYLAYVQKAIELLDSYSRASRMKLLAMLTRLRQICCDPFLCIENYPGGSAKLEECLRMCEELTSSGHRILIFSQFTSMLSRISQRLDELHIENFTLQGDTPITERANLVREFNAGIGQVFLISLKAGGTGLNLTGADTVIHFDPWWNTSAQNQATDRCYRIGQDKSVTVYKLIAKDSIEEKIIRLQDMKLTLAKVVTDNSDGTILDMSIDDIKELLETE